MGFKLAICTLFIVAAVTVALIISTIVSNSGWSLIQGSCCQRSRHCHYRRCFRWTDPSFMLPEVESLRARRFTWGSSLRASGGAHQARSNRPFVVLWRLCRRLISAARAALGDGALAKTLTRWRRSVKLVKPSVPRDI